MKNKILCFGLVLIFLTSMCGCNAEKADILESSDIADCSSSVSNTETSDETDTTVKSEPEKLTETAITTSEPISESNETAPTESKKPVEADKTDIPAAPKAETEKPKPEAPKPPVSEETKEPKKPVQSDKEPPAEQPTEEVKPKTAYDYEFDIEAIRSDLISLGCSMGLTHITTDDGMAITPDNYHILKTTYYEADPSEITGLNVDALGVLINPDSANRCKEMKIKNWDAALYEFDEHSYLCWTDTPEISYVLEYSPEAVPDEEIVKMAESAETLERNK